MKEDVNLNQYIKGNMSEVELDNYTKKIVKNYFEEEELKTKWKNILNEDFNYNIEEENPKNKPNKKSKNTLIRKLYSIASIAAGVLILVYFFYQQPKSNPNSIDALLQEHYQSPYPSRNIVKGIEEEVKPVLNEAHQAYQEKKFEQAILKFNQILNDKNLAQRPSAVEDHFYLALSYLYNKQTKLAIREFDLVLTNEIAFRKNDTSWFLALALLDQGNTERAAIYLKEIAKQDTNAGLRERAAKAKSLLQEIE